MTPFLLLFLVTLTAATFSGGNDNLVVQTVQGKLRGSILKTYTGKDVLSFRGVKYAEAPSGPNRFRPPVPVKPWDGIRNATEDGQLCPQPYFDNTAEDPEDCLLLNVYTKTLQGNQSVMVFIHHGGFLTGGGFSKHLGPRYLLDKDIVLVTLNYRLGALGFLTTMDSTFPSNNGMKDQVTALSWVKQNIASFGGNPDAVTIFGNSAGSASVMFHMLSPLSKGLFVRAIAMSGSVLGGWAINRDPRSLAYRLGDLLGCSSTKNSAHLHDCLKNIPAQNIANATLGIKDFGLDAFSIFAPVIEDSCHHGKECFLPKDPVELLHSNKNELVPLMTGITTDEISYRAELLLKKPELAEQFDKEFDRYAPVEFQYTRSDPESKNISHELRRFYFGNKTINNDTETELGMAYADAHLIYSGIEAAKLIANLSRRPVYFYLFDYSGRYSSRFYPGSRVKPGVLHSDDLIYLFSNTLFLPEFNTTDPEAKVISIMTTLWTNFAITGNPNSNTITPGVEWKGLDVNHDEHNFKYLRITDKLEVKKCSPFPARMALWKTLLPVRGKSPQIEF